MFACDLQWRAVRPHGGEADDVPEVNCGGLEGLGYEGLAGHQLGAD